MAATDFNWYDDYKTEDKFGNVHRKRLIGKMAGSATLAETLAPEWNEEPAVGSNFNRIPPGALTVPEPKEPQAAFKEFLTGMASTPVYTMSADFAKFNRDRMGVEDAETRELGVAIRNYIATDAGEFDYGTEIDPFPISGVNTHTFDTFNFFRILSDGGDPDLTIDEFVCEGEFVQRPLPSKQGKIYLRRTVVQEYELYHVGRAILDALPMSVVAKHMREAVSDLSDTLRYGGSYYKLAYDSIWYDDANSRLYFTAQALGEQFGGVEGSYALRFKFYSFSDLFHIIQAFGQSIYRSFARTTTATFDFSSLKDATQDGVACPLDVWAFNKCAGSVTPAEDVSGGLNRDLLLFMGGITFGEDEQYVGGLLYNGPDNGGKENTLDRDDLTAWEFISKFTIGSMAKAKFVQDGAGAMTIHFLRHYESLNTHALRLSDIIFDGHDAEESLADFTESEYTVASVTAALNHKRGDDYGDHVERQPQKSSAEKTATIKLMFDNLPIVGAEGDWQQITVNATLDTHQSQGVFAAAIMRQHYPWKIFAMADSLPGFSGSVPCRVLPSTNFYHWGPTPGYHEYTNISVSQPMPGASYNWKNDFLRPLRAANSSLQQTTGMLYGSARSGLIMYGSEKLTKVMLTVIASKASINDVGDLYQPLNTSDVVDIQALVLTDEVDVSDLPTKLFLKSVKRSDKVNSVECEFIGMPY